jgi:hypothetical protein
LRQTIQAPEQRKRRAGAFVVSLPLRPRADLRDALHANGAHRYVVS